MKTKLSRLPAETKCRHGIQQLVTRNLSRVLGTTCIFLLISLTLLICLQSFEVETFHSVPLDSLLNELKTAKEDNNKVNILNSLSRNLLYSEPDKALNYAEQSLKLAKKLAKSPDYTKAMSGKKGIANSYNNIGNVHFVQGNYEKAIMYYQKSLIISEELGLKKYMGMSYINIGGIYKDHGNYEKAIMYYQKSLKIFEELCDKRYIVLCYNGIGVVHLHLKNYEKAIMYYQKSIIISKELGHKENMGMSYGNIGNVYYEQGSSASTTILAAYNYDKAIEYYQKSLKISEELGDKRVMAIIIGCIASLNNKQENFHKAIEFAEKSLNLAKEIDALSLEMYAYGYLSESYEGLNNTGKALEYYKLYTDAKDSLFNEEKHKQITEIQTKYETEKKEKEIVLLNKEKKLQKVEIEKKDAEVKKKNLQRNAFIAGFVLLLLLAIVIFRSYRQKKKANINLGNKNKIIEKQKNNIISSINYAKRIQESILIGEEEIQKHLPDSFIYFQPRDIVSGDFYWFSAHPQRGGVQKKSPSPFGEENLGLPRREAYRGGVASGRVIIAAVDCTGHGVPGAFMSMIGNMLLNKIVNEKQITEPAEILNQLHTGVLTSLQQEKKDAQSQDGMDIALCTIDIENKQIQYAGAINPLYIVHNNTLDVIDADFHSIGGKSLRGETNIERTFTNHTIPIQKNTSIYMFTDGYVDQFGGEKNTKFNISRFKQLLIDNHKLDMNQQKAYLHKAMEDWKQNNKQIDDILVIGIRI